MPSSIIETTGARTLIAAYWIVAGLTACGGGGAGAPVGAGAPPAAAAPAASEPSAGVAQAGELTLLVGDVDGAGNLDGQGAQARFSSPTEVVVDKTGNVYVVDDVRNLLRRINPQGQVSTVASVSTTYRHPRDWRAGQIGSIALDPNGDVVLASRDIRKVNASGEVSTLARGPALEPRWGLPGRDRVIDAEGRMFGLQHKMSTASPNEGQFENSKVVRILWDANGDTTLVPVPSATGARGDQLSLAVDPKGRVHLAWNKAGTNQLQLFRMGDEQVFQPISPPVDVTQATTAGARPRMDVLPDTHAVDADGNAYLNCVVGAQGQRSAFVKVTPAGVATLMGSLSETGAADGPLSGARFGMVEDIAADAAGNLYVADSMNNNIRRIDSKGEVSTWAGSRGRRSLQALAAPAVLGAGEVGTGVEDLLVSPSGREVQFVLVIGNPAFLNSPCATEACKAEREAWHLAYTKQLFRLKDGGTSVDAVALPMDFADNLSVGGYRVGQDLSGNFYSYGKKVSPDGQPLPLSSGQTLLVDPDSGKTVVPAVMAVDRQGVVTSAYGRALVRWRPGADAPEFKVQVGSLSASPVSQVRDGVAGSAGLAGVKGMATDAAGNVYFADSSEYWHEDFHNLIRKMSPDGTVTTLAGTPGQFGSADGKGAAASFLYPSDVALDSAGNIYVADSFNYTVRKVTPDGVVSTVAGQAGKRGIRLGPLPGLLDTPTAIEIDDNDVLYIATPGAVLKVKLPR